MSDTWVATLKSWAAAVLASADMNQEIRDRAHVLSLAVDGDTSSTTIKHRHLSGTNAARPAFGEAGRLYYATDDPKVVWLDDGAAWIIVGGAVPHVRAYRDTNQSITNDTSTAISFSGERWDNDNMWVIGAPTRLTIQHTGLYAIGGSVQWAANATGRRYLSIVANAATNLGGTQVDEADSGSEVIIQNVSTHYRLNATDYLELMVRQVSTAALNVTSVGNYSPDLWATFLGP